MFVDLVDRRIVRRFGADQKTFKTSRGGRRTQQLGKERRRQLAPASAAMSQVCQSNRVSHTLRDRILEVYFRVWLHLRSKRFLWPRSRRWNECYVLPNAPGLSPSMAGRP